MSDARWADVIGDPDWGALVWTAMTTGARRGELCAIRLHSTAYTSMLRAWRQAARLLGENPTEDE